MNDWSTRQAAEPWMQSADEQNRHLSRATEVMVELARIESARACSISAESSHPPF